MEFGLERVLLQLSKLKYTFQKANKSNQNVVDEIYKNDGRTPLFMLEGLCRLYKNIYDKSYFENQLALYKRLEDAIGAYDYHIFIREESKNIALSAALKSVLNNNIEKAKNNVQEILIADKWLQKDTFDQLITDYKGIKWLNEKDELKAIEKAYKKEVKKAKEFLESLSFPLNNVEDQVHELRRKLRWLSIYTHALDGLVKLDESSISPQDATLITPKIIASPFNKIIPNLKYQKHLHLNESTFLILSSVIDQIGILKDEGLTIEQFHLFAEQDSNLNETNILSELNINRDIHAILENASQIIESFKNGQYLDKLMA